ncbi:hypothetical protein, variant 2 [Verruconis gallopava]|uniref:Secreted protein n=1 Tax=Verruconis gallopava TaxID=253628 RepID=A0A0D1YFX4_9PEZI|nr:uncharacterized protein PV09_08709 [Verruconis gallopava]XP_016209521.1 hypothetical protein, variant 1 [Verruconis gallopava]XP_016209522.1 hypothetical protein, variant 2 [Verruconis gallopava]KIV99650.1 hypothetical protein PV09_08709 [Verruconis gallopava]KIV99651.1 hypothetical protein, variant 1 [Verruconis gallopava]KIV99652.1 hypothetical protein, variant 2 [Verruconis gallopava]
MVQVQSFFLAAVFTAAPALAFTNGTLVPAYICNPVNDGMPKSFGQLLQLTREQTPTVAFNQNAGQNVKAPLLQQQGNSKIGNSAYILASLHDSPNNINTKQQSLVVKPQNGNTIVAGQANKITISTQDNSQLKGALLYGQDSTGTRQGSFTDASGGPFVPFPGCGKNPQGQISGVIQQTGVSASSSYSSLVYNAPACIPGNNITIGGLSVTGSGFGIWTYSFQVTGSSCGGGNGKSGAGNTGSSNSGSSKTGSSNTGSSNSGSSNTGSSNSGSTGKTGSSKSSSSGSNSGAGTSGNNAAAAMGGCGSPSAAASAATAAAAGAATAASAATAATPTTPSVLAQNATTVSTASAKVTGKGKAGWKGWKAPTTLSKVAQKAQTTCTK